MPRFNVTYSTNYRVSSNYVPLGMSEGQVYSVVSEIKIQARNEKHARKTVFDGWMPENHWEFGREVLNVELNTKALVS